MNRLRDYEINDSASERGFELLRGTPATASMPELKRRVWTSLERARMRAPSGYRMSGVKALAMGVTIVSLAGTAGAVITGRWIVPALDRSAALSQPPGARLERSRATRRIASMKPREAALEPSVASAPVQPAPAASRSTEVIGRSVRRPAPKASAAGAAERTQVLDALVALRRDHDAFRAGELLDTYLSTHRRGALREEALALAVEAADARGDRGSAQRLARTYQIEFPEGRFRDFARSHVTSSKQ
jgi:hypothetical protein